MEGAGKDRYAPGTANRPLIIDGHTHVKHGDKDRTEVPAERVVSQMDEAGIDWSVILSICAFGSDGSWDWIPVPPLIERIRSYGLREDETAAILGGNIQQLLKDTWDFGSVRRRGEQMW